MYSTIYLDTDPDTKFNNESELNDKIAQCGESYIGITVSDGIFKCDCANDGFNDFDEDSDFANLLSQYLESGSVKLIYKPAENNSWMYKITPDGVDRMVLIAMDSKEFKEYSEFKKSK